MSDELIPCPYCGHEPYSFRFDNRFPFPDIEYTVECRNSKCPVKPSVTRGTEEEATEAWNTRAERTCHFKCKKHWIMYDMYECDECGFEVSTLISEGGIEWRYYPNCGAKVVNS